MYMHIQYYTYIQPLPIPNLTKQLITSPINPVMIYMYMHLRYYTYIQPLSTPNLTACVSQTLIYQFAALVGS